MKNSTLLHFLFVFGLLSVDHCIGQETARALPPQLGEALSLSPADIEALSWPDEGRREVRGETVSGFTVDRLNRNSVVSAYHQYYRACDNYALNHEWNGNVKFCEPGTVSETFQNDTLRRINWFRAQVGLPGDIYFDSAKNVKSQQSALMMSRNDALDHTPPSSWLCYTAAGAEAAFAGNLSIGNFGPGAVNSQIRDDGSNNATAGHRRWLLYSRARVMGSGSIPTNDQGFRPTTCIWVVGDFNTTTNTGAVAWPNDGFVPCDIVPNDSQDFPRWSFSYPNANFSNATVTMSRGGTSIPVTLEQVVDGPGDNTLVWRPQGIPAGAVSQDTTYTVMVSGVTGAPENTYRYNVTLIDPFQLANEAVVTGPSNPFVGVSSSYDFTTVEGADSYQVSVASSVPGTWLEGAESLGATISDNTSSSYSLQSSAVAASGRYAFHLTFPRIEEIEQNFVITREIIPAATSFLQFKNRFGFVTEETQLIAEISGDKGASWREIWSRRGDAASNSGSSTIWRSERIQIPESYHSRSVTIRFRLDRVDATSLVFVGTSDSTGAFVDDIEVTRSEELRGSSLTDLPGSASGFSFTPSDERNYVFRVRPRVGSRWFGYGPVFLMSPTSGAPSPAIQSISSGSGLAGSVVTLAGDHFSSIASQNIVRFRDTQAVVTSASATRVIVRVPDGLVGSVEVTVSVGGRNSNAVAFQILGAPRIDLTPSTLDFDEVLLGNSRQLTLQVRNGGMSALSVTQISLSNGAFRATPAGSFTVAPNAVRDVVVTFAPSSVGNQSATLTIASNDTNSPSVAVSLSGAGVSKEVVYQTDFADFDKGLNTIDGVDGWGAINPGDGVQGTVDTTSGPNLGRSAFIGFNSPSDDFNGIFRRFDRDPIAEQSPLVEFSVDLAVRDSTNFFYDIFSFRFYNAANNLLATVTLDNRNLHIHTWDGMEFRDTDRKFENDVLFTLSGRIDFASNRWSAEMRSGSPGSNHSPLFENIPFHSGGKALDLGSILFAWQLDDPVVPGDNWMVIDNLEFSLIGKGADPSPIAITRAWRDQNGVFRMSWPAASGKTYEVRHSNDLVSWQSGLPGSTFITNGELEHTFADSYRGESRYYRVVVLP